MQSTAANVDSYFDEVTPERKVALQKLRALCLQVLKGYNETMQYGMPSYLRKGMAEVSFNSQKNHISIYILKQDAMDAHRDEIKLATMGKGCIRYSKPEKIEWEVIKKMLEATLTSTNPIC